MAARSSRPDSVRLPLTATAAGAEAAHPVPSPPPVSRPDDANSAKLKLDRLKVRADFLRCAAGIRRVAQGMTLEACATPAKFAKAGGLRVGFTASRKIGNAVVRNRAKRRLRAAAAALLPLYGREGHYYVLVARAGTPSRPFAELLEDLAVLLKAAHAKLDRAAA